MSGNVPYEHQTPRMKSRKQHIRLWFEYYKLAWEQPELQDNLKRSKDYYVLWGTVIGVEFDQWWKTHSHLFGETKVQKVQRVSKSPNVINVAVPIDQPVTESLRTIKQMVEDRQNERIKELGINPSRVKSKAKVLQGKYQFTPGVELRGKTDYEIQLIYKLWLELGKPAINDDFCMKVVDWFKSRPRKSWVPYQLSVDPQKNRKGKLEYSESQIRQIRRYIKKAEGICESVSRGQFPGKTRLR